MIVLLNYVVNIKRGNEAARKQQILSSCCVKLNSNMFHIVEFSILTDWILSSMDSPRRLCAYLNSTVGCCCSFPITLCPTRRPAKKSYFFFLFCFPHPRCISFPFYCYRLLASCPAVKAAPMIGRLIVSERRFSPLMCQRWQRH